MLNAPAKRAFQKLRPWKGSQRECCAGVGPRAFFVCEVDIVRMKTKHIGLRVDATLDAMLRAVSAVTGESFSAVARRCLRNGVRFEAGAKT